MLKTPNNIREVKTIKEICVVGGYSSTRRDIKRRLLKDGILKNQCYICGQLPEWNGKPLTLHLDHINGIPNDNRLENLRILCPHCHSQTDTYAGKNTLIARSKPIPPAKLNPKWRNGPRFNLRKALRVSAEELQKLLWEKPTTKIAKDYGVSDKAVEKWAKRYGLSKPPRGYWQKPGTDPFPPRETKCPDKIVLERLLQEKSLSQIAKELDIDRKTLYGWRKKLGLL